MVLMECKNVSKYFSGFAALDDVSLSVDEGELVGLIGPNGSGKSTLFNCISGIFRPEKGDICFSGKNLAGYGPEKIARMGIIRTFQINQLFKEMTVTDNLLLAIQHFQGENVFKSILRLPSVKLKEKSAREKASEIIEFFKLAHLKNEKAKNLSHGQQKLLSIAMSMMPSPKILLMDEPAAYVNMTLMEEIKTRLLDLNQQGIAIFLIEHNMKVLMDICKRVYVLDSGRLIAEGCPAEIQKNEEVIAAYFGE